MSSAGMRRGFLGGKATGKPANKSRGPVPTTSSDKESASTSGEQQQPRAAADAPAGHEDEEHKAHVLKKLLKQAEAAKDFNERLPIAMVLPSCLPHDPDQLEAAYTKLRGVSFLRDLLYPICKPTTLATPEKYRSAVASVLAGLNVMAAMVVAPNIARSKELPDAFMEPLMRVIQSKGFINMAGLPPNMEPLAMLDLHNSNEAILAGAATNLACLLAHHRSYYTVREHSKCLLALTDLLVDCKRPGPWLPPVLGLLRTMLQVAEVEGWPGSGEFSLEALPQGHKVKVASLAAWLAARMGDTDTLAEDPKRLKEGQVSLRQLARDALPCFHLLLRHGGIPLLQLLEDPRAYPALATLLSVRPTWLTRAVYGVCWTLLEKPKSGPGSMRLAAFNLAASLLPVSRGVPFGWVVPVLGKSGEKASQYVAEVIASVLVPEYRMALEDVLNPTARTTLKPRPGTTGSRQGAPAEPSALDRGLHHLRPLLLLSECLSTFLASPAGDHLPEAALSKIVQLLVMVTEACAEAINSLLPALNDAQQQHLLQALKDPENDHEYIHPSLGPDAAKGAAVFYPLRTAICCSQVVPMPPLAPCRELLRHAACMLEGYMMGFMTRGVATYLANAPQAEANLWLDAMATPEVVASIASLLTQEVATFHENRRLLEQQQAAAGLPVGPRSPVPGSGGSPQARLVEEASLLQGAMKEAEVVAEQLMLALEMVLQRMHARSLLGPGENEAGPLGAVMRTYLDAAAKVAEWAHQHQLAAQLLGGDDLSVEAVLRAMPQHELLGLRAGGLVARVLLAAAELLEEDGGAAAERAQGGQCEVSGRPSGRGAAGRLAGAMPMKDLEACCGLVLWSVQLGVVQLADTARFVGRLAMEEGAGGAGAGAGGVLHWSQAWEVSALERLQETLDWLLGTATQLLQCEPWLLKQAAGAQWLQAMAPTLLGLQAHQQQPLAELRRVSDCILQQGVEVTALQAFVRACLAGVTKLGLDELD